MALKPFCLKSTVTSLVALTVFLPATGCDLANNHTKIDRSTNSEFQDFRDMMAPREAGLGDAPVAEGVPELQPYVADDVQKLPPMPLVSIAINQSIPLREALFEMAKQSDFDIELDPRIQGSIIFTARNKPMDVVIDRICEIAGLRYKFDENTLRIELDTPYTKNYKIDYLSFVRKNTSSMKTDVSVASSGGENGGVKGGSQFAVSSDSTADFWGELDVNLKQILDSNASGSYLKTSEDPQIAVSTPAPVTPPVPPIDGAALGEGAASGAASMTPQAGDEVYVSSPVSLPEAAAVSTAGAALDANAAAAPATASVTPPSDTTLPAPPVSAPPQATAAAQPAPVSISEGAPTVPVTNQPPTLRIESLPTSLSGGSTGQNTVSFTPSYSINKQAGLISVYANERLHKKVAEYLDELKRSSTAQVLIEAKVLEVSLSDEYATGINWDFLKTFGDVGLSATFAKPAFSVGSTNGVSFSINGDSISSLVDAISRFGTVHALASPRLTVINNQSAVLNVARNQVYFELKVQRDTTSDGTNTNVSTDVDSEIKTVPEGVLINVLPSINLDKHTVAMQLRPTVTKISEYVNDPSVTFASGGTIESPIPIVNVQEVDSVVDMRSGQMMVMGGLLQDSSTSSQEGVPVASEIPIFGGLFRNQGDHVKKTELVIFLKATILDDARNSIHNTDRELYKTFSQDRRPEKL